MSVSSHEKSYTANGLRMAHSIDHIFDNTADEFIHSDCIRKKYQRTVIQISSQN